MQIVVYEILKHENVQYVVIFASNTWIHWPYPEYSMGKLSVDVDSMYLLENNQLYVK